jgi:glycosyltransferase involved in cell wall biosynthesis
VLRGNDAVGFDAVMGASALADAGMDVELFSADAEGCGRPLSHVDELPRRACSSDSFVLFHHSFGWPRTEEVLRACRGKRLIKAHNVTPAEFFVGHSEAHVAACSAGRLQIEGFANGGADGVIGDSLFNLTEFLEAGFLATGGRIAPPFTPARELIQVHADIDVLDRLTDGAMNVLMVGRIAPNKNHRFGIEVIARMQRELGLSARLVCVGKLDDRLAGYRASLLRHAECLGVSRSIAWLGEASRAVLKAAYVASDVLLVPSLHEGFCVPLVEAMALGVPVVALNRSASGETLGAAGISLDEPDSLAFAIAAQMVRSDSNGRAAMVRAGRERFEELFANAVAARRLVDAVVSLL